MQAACTPGIAGSVHGRTDISIIEQADDGGQSDLVVVPGTQVGYAIASYSVFEQLVCLELHLISEDKVARPRELV